MRGIFYLKFKGKLKQVHECLVPDNSLTYKLVGFANIEVKMSSVTNRDSTMVQQIVFNRVSVLGDEAMYVFDADTVIK